MKKGFTLIEIIVILLIFGILATISFPLYNKTIKRTGFKEVVNIVSLVKAGAKYYVLKYGAAGLPANETAWDCLKVDKPSDSGAKLTYVITSSGAGNPALQVSYDGSILYEYDLITGIGAKTGDPDAAYLPDNLP